MRGILKLLLSCEYTGTGCTSTKLHFRSKCPLVIWLQEWVLGITMSSTRVRLKVHVFISEFAGRCYFGHRLKPGLDPGTLEAGTLEAGTLDSGLWNIFCFLSFCTLEKQTNMKILKNTKTKLYMYDCVFMFYVHQFYHLSPRLFSANRYSGSCF